MWVGLWWLPCKASNLLNPPTHGLKVPVGLRAPRTFPRPDPHPPLLRCTEPGRGTGGPVMGACMVMWSAVKGLDLTLKPSWRKRQSDVVTSGWLVGSPGLLGRCPEDCGRIGLGGNAEQRQKGAVPSPDARPRGAAVGSGEEQKPPGPRSCRWGSHWTPPFPAPPASLPESAGPAVGLSPSSCPLDPAAHRTLSPSTPGQPAPS